MLRIIFWSPGEIREEVKSLSQFASQETNNIPVVTSEAGALTEINRISQREKFGDTRLLFINAELNLTDNEVSHLIERASKYSGDWASFSIDFGSSFITCPEIEAGTLIQSLSAAQTWNTNIVLVKESLTQEIVEQDSLSSALLKMAVRAMGDHGQVDWNLENLSLQLSSGKNPSQYEQVLSNRQNADLIQYAIASINIEELFPQHAWNDFEAESAAACYHALAARFIALGAYDNAQECLQYGDRLEDSPRSLALKGLIALQQGEVLAAVANMVSSLQEYEKRKIESPNHYLSFKPQNLEVINSSLQNGLTALNKRENDRAAEFFTDAVFHFDEFYNQYGLSQQKV
ncbi:MAG: hypothetical protein KDD70_09170 [Bdellovibrionales bacterium]|nr:hypothetical protein [Bdellovibrionales bacterium]